MPEYKRRSGVILPIFSLPSPYGVGTLGKAAHEFASFLAKGGQSLWQLLPLGPTGFGDSPYQSFSVFAGNPYFIDLDELAAMGLLEKSEIDTPNWGSDERRVDYEKLFLGRRGLLRLAFGRIDATLSERIRAFYDENVTWLFDFALFMALKDHFDMHPWYEWPDDVRAHDKKAIEKYSTLLKNEIELETFIQYLFFEQLSALRQRCKALGVSLMGDIPIYTALDSADVWANQSEFFLDGRGRPTEVAGVPPDYFSETGQLWGNPLYRWDKMEKNGFAWWRSRISVSVRAFDILRLDHFRGLESYWSIPYGSESAAVGKWNKGPGKAFIDRLKESFPDTEFIAEDLGIITKEVRDLREYSGMAGMAVLSFAFDPKNESAYLPHNLLRKCVCYTGTHDNNTLSGTLEDCTAEELSYIEGYCGGTSPIHIMRAGLASCAGTFMAQMQDWLELGSLGRINTPGLSEGCWQWRLLPRELTEELAQKMNANTKIFCRNGHKEDSI